MRDDIVKKWALGQPWGVARQHSGVHTMQASPVGVDGGGAIAWHQAGRGALRKGGR